MQKVKALKILSIPKGRILSSLSPDQIRRRRHALAELDGEQFRAEQELCFKVGEEFEIDDAAFLAKSAAAEVDGAKPAPKKKRATRKKAARK